MWLLGSPSQLMMMDERLSPSARSVQSPGNPSTIHSIEAILGFKEDTIFHKSASYTMTDKVLVKDTERNGDVPVTPTKKSHYSESFNSKYCWVIFLQKIATNVQIDKRDLYSEYLIKHLDNLAGVSQVR